MPIYKLDLKWQDFQLQKKKKKNTCTAGAVGK